MNTPPYFQPGEAGLIAITFGLAQASIHEWISLAEFDTWHWQEACVYLIELILLKLSLGNEFGSERSGKRTKLDVLSTLANAQAHVPPSNMLPFPNLLPHVPPFTSTPDVIACAPGPSLIVSGDFVLTPNPSIAHAFPLGPVSYPTPG